MRDTRHIDPRAALVRHALAGSQPPLPKKLRMPAPALIKVVQDDGYTFSTSRPCVRSVGMQRMVNLLLTPEKGVLAA